MCGILGAINVDFDEKVLDLICHRGPDGAGIVRRTLGRHRITLGHRRLAIVDLSPAGAQPMATKDGRCLITYNGEVYNHQTLRTELRGTPFNGHSDTETILKYLQQYGILGVQRFNGIFAFGFVDETKNKLYLARDPFGVKPLYYSRGLGTFVFASEIKPILHLIPDTLDLDNLAEVLRLRYSPSPDTLFSNLRKVRPGHILEVDLSRLDLPVREYPFLVALPETIGISFPDAVDRYGKLFEAAIQRQLMSDIEVGILLSGGVDSALVAAYAQKHCPYRMKAFTVGFKERNEDADEIADARETARILDLDHYVVRIGFEDFLASVRECVSVVEEPAATTSISPMFYLSNLVSKHVKVVLSGQGADEPLGGYRRYQIEILRQLLPKGTSNAMAFLARLLCVQNDAVLRGVTAAGESDDMKRFLHVYSVFDEAEIVQLIGRRDTRSQERLAYFYNLLGCARQQHGIERMMSIDTRMNLPDELLLYTDKIAMHYSIECRVPILDLELVRFIESLPYQYRVRLWRTKIVHKDFARKVLPDFIIRRRKKGFDPPIQTWFSNREVLRGVLLDRSSRFASVFDLDAVEKLLEEHEKGFNRGRHIFLLLRLYYWFEEFL